MDKEDSGAGWARSEKWVVEELKRLNEETRDLRQEMGEVREQIAMSRGAQTVRTAVISGIVAFAIAMIQVIVRGFGVK